MISAAKLRTREDRPRRYAKSKAILRRGRSGKTAKFVESHVPVRWRSSPAIANNNAMEVHEQYQHHSAIVARIVG